MKLKKYSKRIFEKNSCLPPRGFFTKKPPFLAENGLWAYIFETAHQILMIFSQMLNIVALNDLASVLYNKNSSSPIAGNFAPKNVKNPPYDSDFLKLLDFAENLHSE